MNNSRKNISALKGFKRLLLGCLFFVSVVQQIHALTLRDLEFNRLSRDQLQIKLIMDSANFALPVVVLLSEPKYLIVDLNEPVTDLEKTAYQLKGFNGDVQLIIDDNRTRLLIKSKDLQSYTTEMKGNEVLITVQLSQAAQGNSQSTQSVSANFSNHQMFEVVSVDEVENPIVDVSDQSYLVEENSLIIDQNRLTNLDFKRLKEGAGWISLQLESPNIDAKVKRAENGLSISINNTELAQEVNQAFDVTDFATPVGQIQFLQKGRHVSVDLLVNKEFEYTEFQENSNFIIVISPVEQKIASKATNRNTKGQGNLISISWQDIEIRKALHILAELNQLNVIVTDAVTGKVSVTLTDVPWEQALNLVLRAKGLAQRTENNVMLVAPLEQIAEHERLELEANKQYQKLAPMHTEYLDVQYADATKLFELLVNEKDKSGMLSDDGSAKVDQRTNTIVITDTTARINEFKKLLEKLDVPIKQVLIEARIVAANSNFRRELGVRWGGLGVRSLSGGSVGARGAATLDEVRELTRSGAGNVADTPIIDLGTESATSSFALSFLTNSNYVDLELSALENEGFGEVISQPKVLTGDNQTAYIKSGQEIPFQQAAGDGATATSFKEAVLELQVTPQITPDNHIILDLLVKQDAVASLVLDGEPAIDVTELRTQVLVSTGETLVLGGIFQLTTSNTERKVPFLGDLPFVGRVFKNTTKGHEKQEILIFITTKILSEQELVQK